MRQFRAALVSFTKIRYLRLSAGLLQAISAALADEPVSQDEAKSIQATLQEWGCQGGEMERTGTPFIYEIDDALCDEREDDIKLDDKFDVIPIARH